MSKTWNRCLVAAIALAQVAAAVVHSSEGGLWMLSLSLDGTAGNGPSRQADLSRDGRFVVFESAATDLVFNDLNNATDLYVWDRQSETTELLLPTGTVHLGVGEAQPSISGTGRYVAFNSRFDGSEQTYIYDRVTGVIDLVSAIDGMTVRGNGEACGRPDVSDDGDLVLFCSDSNDLVVDDSNDDVAPKPRQIFLRLRSRARTLRLTDPAAEPVAAPNGDSWDAVLSANGRSVAFVSEATNLPFAGGDATRDIFLWSNKKRRIVSRLDVDLEEGFVDGNAQVEIDGRGRAVAFTTPRSLVAEDTDFRRDVYVYEDEAFHWVSPAPEFSTNHPSLSSDGQLVVYDVTLFYVWLYDRATGESRTISRDINGFLRSGQRPRISADGTTVVFDSPDPYFPDLDDAFGDEDVMLCTLAADASR